MQRPPFQEESNERFSFAQVGRSSVLTALVAKALALARTSRLISKLFRSKRELLVDAHPGLGRLNKAHYSTAALATTCVDRAGRRGGSLLSPVGSKCHLFQGTAMFGSTGRAE